VTLITSIRGSNVIPRLAFDIFYLRTKFGDSRFTCSGNMIAVVEIETVSRDPDHARGGLSSDS